MENCWLDLFNRQMILTQLQRQFILLNVFELHVSFISIQNKQFKRLKQESCNMQWIYRLLGQEMSCVGFLVLNYHSIIL